MTSLPVESKAWPRRRWAFLILLVFAGQVGCIFWLAARKTETPMPPVGGSKIYIPADQTADLPGVTDPTLFVLPYSHGFSGPAWLQFTSPNYAPEPWTEPPRPLEVTDAPTFGVTLREFVQSNRPRPFDLALKPEPQLEALGIFPLEDSPSSFMVEGDLADRPLLAPLKLDSWPAADILTNTIVQVAVDAAGRVFSVALVTKCASAGANSNALNFARSARFKPLRWVAANPPNRDRLSWGKIVFHWHTIPLPPAAGLGNK